MQKILPAAALAAALAAGSAVADTTDTGSTETGAMPSAAPEATPSPAPRQGGKAGLHLAFTAGLSAGGDTLAEVTYTNGDSEKLKAGGMIYFAVGPSIEFADSPWSVQAMFGRHFDSVSADNAKLSFERNTFELQAFHRFGDHRIGAGYVKHLSPEYEQSGSFVTPGTAQFADATGLSLEYNWLPAGSKVGFSLRAVKIDYELESLNNAPTAVSETFSGNHFAAGFYVYL